MHVLPVTCQRWLSCPFNLPDLLILSLLPASTCMSFLSFVSAEFPVFSVCLTFNPVSGACLFTCMCFLSFVSADSTVLSVRLLILFRCLPVHLHMLPVICQRWLSKLFFHTACLFCLFFYPIPSIAFLTAISHTIYPGFSVCLAYSAKTQYRNSKQIFQEMELRGHTPNFHINLSMADLYIRRSICLFCYKEICEPILGIYKSLADTRMWKLGLRPRSSQKRWDFRCSVAVRQHRNIYLSLYVPSILNCNPYTCLSPPSPPPQIYSLFKESLTDLWLSLKLCSCSIFNATQ